jgi:DNA-binding transcriptional LysR family regulator
VSVEVLLTRRRVDLVEERFDLAFRVGRVDDPVLAGVELGPARVRYCASPRYVARHGAPARVADLKDHACLVVSDGGPAAWPVPGPGGLRLVPVSGRLVCSSFAMAYSGALAGLGIALCPEFASADAIRRKRLVPVLDGRPLDVGSVWMLHVARRFLPAQVRAFADRARERFAREPALVAR